MPRRGKVFHRELLPDARYHSTLVNKFIKCFLEKGKKSLAERVLYQVFDIIHEKMGKEPLEVFQQAIENVKPVLEVKSRRVGGATYQVPVEIRPDRRNSLAIRWIILYARSRSEKGMVQKLAGEIMSASQNEGGAIKKKEDTHRMAEANRAFAHYRW
jgi:small subunit ribosomal protein S7